MTSARRLPSTLRLVSHRDLGAEEGLCESSCLLLAVPAVADVARPRPEDQAPPQPAHDDLQDAARVREVLEHGLHTAAGARARSGRGALKQGGGLRGSGGAGYADDDGAGDVAEEVDAHHRQRHAQRPALPRHAPAPRHRPRQPRSRPGGAGWRVQGPEEDAVDGGDGGEGGQLPHEHQPEKHPVALHPATLNQPPLSEPVPPCAQLAGAGRGAGEGVCA